MGPKHCVLTSLLWQQSQQKNRVFTWLGLAAFASGLNLELKKPTFIRLNETVVNFLHNSLKHQDSAFKGHDCKQLVFNPILEPGYL